MSAELERLPEEIDAQTRHMLDLALMKARDIEGTYLNDLEAALNMIRQYRRSLSMVGAPDPNGSAATDLLKKYKMYGEVKRPKNESEEERNARMGRELETALGVLAAVREQQADERPKTVVHRRPLELEAGDEEIIDAEVVE